MRKLTEDAPAAIVALQPLRAAHIAALAPRVRVIGRTGVGTDTIDLEAARAARITFLNRPTYSGSTSLSIHGQDVFAVYEVAVSARARALAGDGPTFIEARTYRYSGHGPGEGAHRTADEVARWLQERNPITRCVRRLGVLGSGELELFDKEARQTVDEAVRFAVARTRVASLRSDISHDLNTNQ